MPYRDMLVDEGGFKAALVKDHRGETLGLQVYQDAEPIIEMNKRRKAAGPRAEYGLNGKNGRMVMSLPQALVEKFAIETKGEFMKMHPRDKLKYIKKRNQEGTLDHFILGRI